jgi:hypothetical protein
MMPRPPISKQTLLPGKAFGLKIFFFVIGYDSSISTQGLAYELKYAHKKKDILDFNFYDLLF